MPVPAEDITFTPLGPMNEIATIHRGVGWPEDASNDPYTLPLSTVSMMTNNPYPPEHLTGARHDRHQRDAGDRDDGDVGRG